MSTTESQPAARRSATYRTLFQEREYRTLFAADVVSQLGDQVAAVALAVLVYGASASPLLAALAYSLVFLPWVLGGPLLAALAERMPSRVVLVGSDLSRAALFGLAAVPGLPLAVLALLLLCGSLLSPPFRSARSALIPQILDDESYTLSLSVEEVLNQTAQLAGFVTGGALILLLDPHGALAINAASFAVSGLVLRRGLARRAAATIRTDRTSLLREALAGLHIIASSPALRRPLVLAVVGATYVVVPEAIAPAFVAEAGGGPVGVGLVMGAVATGSAVGAVVMARFVSPDLRSRLMEPLALAGTVPLLLIAMRPSLPVALALFLLAGLCTAYNVPANACFAAAVPPGARARAFGLAMTAMMTGQLFGVLLGGLLAEVLDPSQVVGVAGAAGLLTILALRLDRAGPAGPAVVDLDPAFGASPTDSTAGPVRSPDVGRSGRTAPRHR